MFSLKLGAKISVSSHSLKKVYCYKEIRNKDMFFLVVTVLGRVPETHWNLNKYLLMEFVNLKIIPDLLYLMQHVIE